MKKNSKLVLALVTILISIQTTFSASNNSIKLTLVDNKIADQIGMDYNKIKESLNHDEELYLVLNSNDDIIDLEIYNNKLFGSIRVDDKLAN